jgi:hypothetical protein
MCNKERKTQEVPRQDGISLDIFKKTLELIKRDLLTICIRTGKYQTTKNMAL